jgi:hypothetical protein
MVTGIQSPSMNYGYKLQRSQRKRYSYTCPPRPRHHAEVLRMPRIINHYTRAVCDRVISWHWFMATSPHHRHIHLHMRRCIKHSRSRFFNTPCDTKERDTSVSVYAHMLIYQIDVNISLCTLHKRRWWNEGIAPLFLSLNARVG